jgi:hypothetical protein
MIILASGFKKHYLTILSAVVPIGLYLGILFLPVPVSISVFFSQFSILFFFFTLVAYYVSFRLGGNIPWFFAACLTALVFAMRLSYLWTSGYSGNMILVGLLPFRDGFGYYSAASFLFDGHLFSNVAAWRPMFTGFVASLLLLTQHNLTWTMAILVGLAGMACFLSAYLVFNEFGALAAALYFTFLYFYILEYIGLLYTESLGLALGCLGFILLWRAARAGGVTRLAYGMAILMVAVIVRAGTFFVFPVLVVWAGWAFRNQARFSYRTAMIAFVAVVIAFFAVNSFFGRSIVEPDTQSFGNFAFTLYGQVVGGAGYSQAVQRFGNQNTPRIYRAAFDFFLHHPLSFFIGTAKAYRDFFFGSEGIFRYYPYSSPILWRYLIWITGLGLTLSGVVKAVRKIMAPVYSLMIAVLVGILISIPFLPPVDGGIRIYASIMPFFFGFLAISVGRSSPLQKQVAFEGFSRAGLEILAGVVIVLITIVPLVIQRTGSPPQFAIPACAPDQVPYVVEVHQGSFVDVYPEKETACGRPGQICASDFERNSLALLTDASDAEVYRAIVDVVAVQNSTGSATRFLIGNDLVSETPYLFLGPVSQVPVMESGLIAGCGNLINIKKRPEIIQIQTGFTIE